MLIIPSPAKINLHLRVLRKRPDGYHEIATLMHAIDLCDEMSFRRIGRGVELETSGISVDQGAGNLASRAARLLMDNYRPSKGVRITLKKHIPVAAGLGGGSSNAATTLKALNRLWGLDLKMERLHHFASALGSDVPFFLSGAAAVGRGRGEILSPVAPLENLHLLLVVPPFQVTSTWAYANLNLELTKTDDDISMMQSIINTEKIEDWAPLLRNDLEASVIRRYPEIERIKVELLRNGAEVALMSGSGPVVFGLYIKKGIARQAAEILKGEGRRVILSRTITRMETPESLRGPGE
jgi:4-diphosphocytidyl-2-C-methyl-D-erythritol kinase